ncbi:MAG: PDZ domain-containing protein [Candidatus Melainabacteria bacterium]|nr:PDZ domain-containing protein [Candidatus Melainabacteria bacterium]
MQKPKAVLILLLAGILGLGGFIGLPASLMAQSAIPFEQPNYESAEGYSQFGPFGSQPPGYLGGAIGGSQYEELYHMLWAQIGNMYFDQDALKNWASWEHKFDGKLDSREALDNALKAMFESLRDQWTRYATIDEQIKKNQNNMRGNVSLGIFLKRAADGRFEIDFIESGSAAHKSELRRGDILISIGGVDISSKTDPEAADLLNPGQGSLVEVVYESEGRQSTARLIAVPTVSESVEVKNVKDGILYIRFPGFDSPERTAELLDSLERAGQKLSKGVRGIVLDLRGNPGGEFQEALKVASIFMERGVIVKSRTRSGRIISDQTYSVITPLAHTLSGLSAEQNEFFGSLLRAPMVLMVDSNSASAAEVVTGALKDNKRALVVGERTYGKGVGYVTGRGPTGGVITITALKYLTPSGFDLSHKGLSPDIVVRNPRAGKIDLQMTESLKMLEELISSGSQVKQSNQREK